MPVSVNYVEYILEQRSAVGDRPEWLGGDHHPADEHSWIRLSAVSNADDAMRFLNREAPYESAPRPDLVLLDLNLHGVSGHDVLDEIKSNPRFGDIDVIVLTSSGHPTDVNRAYALGAGCYIRKPDCLDDFPIVAAAIKRYWFGVARQRLQTA
ncbi:MAG: response regulator [Phycisphaera sp.]|nr:response regulator [Phycisphaera sp.]